MTINDVAKAAKVSAATVSLALNGNPCVKAQTRERIVQIAREMGYTPNRMAQGLARRRSGSIGLVVPDIESIYYGKVVRFIDDAVGKSGYQLTLAIANESQETERKIIGKFIEQQVEGVIIAPVNRPIKEAGYYLDLDKCRIPYAFITAYYPQVAAPFVMADLKTGTCALVEHLIAKGCRNIFFLAGYPDVVTTESRAEGFLQVVRQNAAAIDQYKIIHCPRVDYSTGYAQALALLREQPRVDAIITINDEMALAALNAAASLGLDVPGQVAIAGYDNMIFSSAANVPITTIDQNIELMCRQMTDLLLDMIRQGDARPLRRDSGTLIETSLIIRQSTDFRRGRKA